MTVGSRFARWVTLALLAGVAHACGDDEEEAERARGESQATAAAAAPAFTAVTDALLTASDAAGDNWLVYGGAYNNQRYSSLQQVNRQNVRDLALAWIYQTGMSESFETTPIVVDNAMYFTTPESHVIAVNAATGERLWEFVPTLSTTVLCCGPNNRGVAAYADKVFVGTLDARLIALNNRTGAVVWEVQVADPEAGYSETMAPLAFDGKVVIGVSGGKYGIRGFVTAYSAEDGKEVWRWYTIPSPEEGGWWGGWTEVDPFGAPLNRDIMGERQDSAAFPETWRVGGGAVWMTPAYDAQTRTLYVGVGNPAPALNAAIRPGDNLYTGSVVALDAQTGKLRWYFQYLPHDRWDLSSASPPFSYTLGQRRYVAQAGKTGWLYIMDAGTGQPILRSDNFVPQENLFAPPTQEGIRVAPGSNGGSNWSPAAFSPRTGLAYVLGVHQPMLLTVQSQPLDRGSLWLGGTFRYVPGEPQWGTLSALDVRTGEIRWQHRTPAPMIGGALVTAGDLLFVGQGSGTFDAFDARTGEPLWQFPTGSGVHGGPISYAVGGVQYIAVASGGNYQLDTPRGDDLFVFALRDRRPPLVRPPYDRAQYARNGPVLASALRQVRRVPPPVAPAGAAAPETTDTVGPRPAANPPVAPPPDTPRARPPQGDTTPGRDGGGLTRQLQRG